MEVMELVIVSALLSITGLVGLAIWLSNQRALEQMRQDNLNHRAELKAGSSHTNGGGEPDLLSTVLDLATKNPELLNQFLSSMKAGQQPPPPGA